MLRELCAKADINGPWEQDAKGRWRKGTWSQGYSGHEYWVLDPRADEIYVDDMVMGICREPRYRGQTSFTYPVGYHSILVSQFCYKIAIERKWPEFLALAAAQYGLVHDSPEAYLGDVTHSLKKQVTMKGYKVLEAKWWKSIVERFQIWESPDVVALVEEVDKRIVIDEVEALFKDPDMWKRYNRYPGRVGVGAEITRLSESQIVAWYYERFRTLFPKEI